MLADYFTNNYRVEYYICLERSLWGENTSGHCTKYLSHRMSMLGSVLIEANIRKRRMCKH